MDALAGYGSNSESDEGTKNDETAATGGGALSGLLGNYSDDSDADANDNDNGIITKRQQKGSNGNNKLQSSFPIAAEEKDGNVLSEPGRSNGGGEQARVDGHTKKR